VRARLSCASDFVRERNKSWRATRNQQEIVTV
jgi:hypothetical protein